jgi:hypothetical protein
VFAGSVGPTSESACDKVASLACGLRVNVTANLLVQS